MAGFVPICQSSSLSLSILLVSDNRNHLKNVAEGLQKTGNGDNANFLKVYCCESISQILKSTEVPHVDFVVICINQMHSNATAEAEQNILKLDQTFLLSRICLLCDNTKTSGSVVPKILHLKQKYELHVLWGDLEAGAESICKRIINLASAVCGVVSGVPLVTFRTWHTNCAHAGDFSAAASGVDTTF